MSRRRRPEKRVILPDPKFGDQVLSKFMNLVMLQGKKSVAESIVYSALEVIETKARREPLGVFHEALNKQMIAALGAKLAERGQANNAQIMTDIQNYHASPEDAARAASEAGVSALVLYHLVPPLPSKLIEPMFLGKAPEAFSGTLKISHDGLIVSLPSGGKAIKFGDAW